MIEILAGIVLGKIGDAFLSALVGKVTDEVWTRLKGDPAKIALKQALGAALKRYASSSLRLDLARPLLEKNGFLTQPAVAQELTQLVRFEREPNAELIGRLWKATMDDPPSWCDFTYETKRLLEYLQVELKNSEVFRPVFEAKSLDAIAASAATSGESLARIEAQLADLAQLMDTRLGDLIRSYTRTSPDIHEQILDYTRFIEEKTYDFVGRQFVFDAVARFIERSPRGYFFIRGDPGIGKSALAAQMVRNSGYVHHFNILSEGINKTETFLRNICAQLIAVYQLNHSFLTPEQTQNADFLKHLLGEVSDKIGSREKAIIVVDALDEVDTLGLSPGANTLYLPSTLTQGIYVIVTTRRIPLHLRIDCEQETLDIEHDSADNITDIRAYVKRAVDRPGIQAYIATQRIDNTSFIKHVVEKSEGNFMYLRYVLPEIEHGAYTDFGLAALPTGLQNYYADHWRRMRGEDEEAWFKYKLPVIVALTVVREPVSIDLIADFSGVKERARIRDALNKWAQFLHEEQVAYEGGLQKRFYVYHASFHEFITKQEEIEDERVSLKEAHKKIADTLFSELYGDE
jgi:hypothetical protein